MPTRRGMIRFWCPYLVKSLTALARPRNLSPAPPQDSTTPPSMNTVRSWGLIHDTLRNLTNILNYFASVYYFLPLCLGICLSVCLSVCACLSVSLVSLSICLSVCPSVSLPHTQSEINTNTHTVKENLHKMRDLVSFEAPDKEFPPTPVTNGSSVTLKGRLTKTRLPSLTGSQDTEEREGARE